VKFNTTKVVCKKQVSLYTLNRLTCFFVSNKMNIQSQDTDEKLRAAILSRLAADDRTAFANLRVGVLNGIAHLAGVVASIEIRIVAAEIAEDVPEIRGVVNRIEAPGAPSPSRSIHLTPNLQREKKGEVK
jgi:osmotically-inducible protein OsmY